MQWMFCALEVRNENLWRLVILQCSVTLRLTLSPIFLCGDSAEAETQACGLNYQAWEKKGPSHNRAFLIHHMFYSHTDLGVGLSIQLKRRKGSEK